MIYPSDIEERLGFHRIKQLIKEHCWGSGAKKKVSNLSFSTDLNVITLQLSRITEFQKIINESIPFPEKYYIDIHYYLNKLKPEGSYLEAEEFKIIKFGLNTAFACINFFFRSKNEYPALYELCSHVTIDQKLYYKINSIIDDNGYVRDNASPELLEIRKNLTQARQLLSKTTEKIMRYLIKEKMVDEDLSPTIRNGRLVVPVKSEYKRKIKGLIHDESATGQTTFIEPAETFEMNNQIRELEIEEQKEIVRILKSLSDFVRKHNQQFQELFEVLTEVDFLQACARFSCYIKAVKPNIVDKTIIDWYQAIHPLLYLTVKENNKTIVPLCLRLDQEQRIILISGPNAGGKSVCLKTVGLLQYMVQCGLPVPMSENSTMGIFKNIFLDIGDEQSIENDLSTYTAHLKNMQYFLQMAGPESLILIDEIGSGTEPHIGSALAQAFIEELNLLRVYGIITTHFATLKSFAANTEGIVNGAMQFNHEKLEPLYLLEIGKPGSSYATEIAKKIGIKDALLQRAKKIAGDHLFEYDNLLKEVEKEKKNYLALLKEYEQKRGQLDKLIQEYQSIVSDLNKNKKKYLDKAKTEARAIVEKTNQIIERTIRQIKEHNAEKEVTKQLRRELDKFKQEELHVEISYDEETHHVQQNIDNNTTINPGDTVKVKGSHAYGEIISIKGKEAEVLIGSLKSMIKIDRLEKVAQKEKKKIEKKVYSNIDLYTKSFEFKPEIDVRGKRVEEALPEVNQLIDNAVLLGIHTVRIIHGKGDGILRTAIRNHLKTFSQITYAVDEHADRGGSGVTVAGLE